MSLSITDCLYELNYSHVKFIDGTICYLSFLPIFVENFLLLVIQIIDSIPLIELLLKIQ